jgi:hypothetical protein
MSHTRRSPAPIALAWLCACSGQLGITPADADAIGALEFDAPESFDATPRDVAVDAGADADLEFEAKTCDDLFDANDLQATAWLDADLACETSADCTTIIGDPECTVACVVPIATAFAADFRAKVQTLCQSYLAQGCPMHQSLCPGFGPAVCVDGGCNWQ